MTKTQAKILMTTIAVLIRGFCVSMFKMSLFGTDPLQCFVAGLSNVFPVSHGMMYLIVSVAILVFIFIFGKKYIGIATIINLFLLGYIVDLSHGILLYFFGEIGLVLRVVFLLFGVLLLGLAAAMFFTADLGISTYDAVALIIQDMKIARFTYARVVGDVICTGVGFFLGAPIGVGTVITAFFMGPIIAWMRKHITDPMLAKVNK